MFVHGISFRPYLLDYQECHRSQPQDNLKKVLAAFEELGVIRLIDSDEGIGQRKKKINEEKGGEGERAKEREREGERERERERDKIVGTKDWRGIERKEKRK